MGRWVGSTLFSVGMIMSTLVVATATVLVAPFPFRVRYATARSFAYFNLWTLRWFCGIRYHVEGTENIPAGPAVVFCKHQSTWETLAMQALFPPQVYVLKRELLRVPFFGWGLARLEPIAIDRRAGRTAVNQVIEQGADRLAKGYWVIVFPEGTRVAAGSTGRYKLGGAVLAAHVGCPAVPVAHNAGEFWPRRSFLKRPGTIEVRVGPPIETAGRKPEEILNEARTWIEATVSTISNVNKK
jgi:1-acyl-sn-glycerol-3-phosphate acyltransferase